MKLGEPTRMAWGRKQPVGCPQQLSEARNRVGAIELANSDSSGYHHACASHDDVCTILGGRARAVAEAADYGLTVVQENIRMTSLIQTEGD